MNSPPSPALSDASRVTVVVPCRNEGGFIGRCLASIAESDFPKDRLEVLVVDGMSEDGTRGAVAAFVRDHPYAVLLDNPKRTTPCALNIGIARATGGVILWMSAHNRYERDYISRSVECLQRYGADNVGGIIRTEPRERTPAGRAIAAALSHPFGVGNSHFRIRTREPRLVDTVFGGCYRREVFARIGGFNEKLTRGQDLEFNLRLRKAGGRTLLVSDIVSTYYARSDVASFVKHNWSNGVWAILPFLYSPIMPVRWRHLVPLAFVAALLAAALAAAIVPSVGGWALLGVAGPYAAAAGAASVHAALRERDPVLLFLLPFTFACLHLGYGLGSLWGAVQVLLRLPGLSRICLVIGVRCG